MYLGYLVHFHFQKHVERFHAHVKVLAYAASSECVRFLEINWFISYVGLSGLTKRKVFFG